MRLGEHKIVYVVGDLCMKGQDGRFILLTSRILNIGVVAETTLSEGSSYITSPHLIRSSVHFSPQIHMFFLPLDYRSINISSSISSSYSPLTFT
jgi:hypothetical protein